MFIPKSTLFKAERKQNLEQKKNCVKFLSDSEDNQ